MRIAHILSSLAQGGQERVAVDLACAQRAAGEVVAVIALGPLPEGSPLAEELRAAGVELRAIGVGAGLEPLLPARLACLLRRLAAEVVHTHNPRALLYGAAAGRLAGAVVVHTKHGANPDGGRRLLLRRAAARLVSALVAVSPQTAEVARRRREVAIDRLLVIENGIRLDRFAPDGAARSRLREALAIPEGALVLGTVGRLAPEKDQALLLRAAAPLLGDAVHLVVVGDGPEAAALEAQARAAGIAPFTHLLGARADVPQLLAAFDVFVLPSRSEGLPLVIAEAMATALPVVASRVGGVPAVIDEGRTGLLVEPGDEAGLRAALIALRDDRAHASRIGCAARKEAMARFSSERMAREYLAVYRRALPRRRVAPRAGATQVVR